jgi:hypothetical protein
MNRPRWRSGAKQSRGSQPARAPTLELVEYEISTSAASRDYEMNMFGAHIQCVDTPAAMGRDAMHGSTNGGTLGRCEVVRIVRHCCLFADDTH